MCPCYRPRRSPATSPMIDETYDVLTPTLEVDGLIADLSPDLKAGKPYPQSYWYPTFLASYIPPKGAPFGVGQVFALPNEADATVIMYNENEFKAAGVPFPQNGWTWSQMLADAAKLKVGSGASQKAVRHMRAPGLAGRVQPGPQGLRRDRIHRGRADARHPGSSQGLGADDRPAA